MFFNNFLGQQRKAADHHKIAALRPTEDGEILCMQTLSAWQAKRLSSLVAVVVSARRIVHCLAQEEAEVAFTYRGPA